MPMAEYADTLYIVSTDKIFASTDKGETWHVLCSRPKGLPTGLVVMDAPEQQILHARPVMYLTLENKGVFRSTDAGAGWNHLQDGLANASVYAVAAIGDTVFAGTNKGLYRLNSGVWQQVPVGLSGPVYAVTKFENNLYIEIGANHFPWGPIESKQSETYNVTIFDDTNSSRILHSTDLGVSWTEITHENESSFMNAALGMVPLTNTSEIFFLPRVLKADKDTFYRAGPWGIHRSTDRGRSWHPFMKGITGTTIQDLVAINNRLYAYTGRDLVQSTNGGETWETLRIDSSNRILKEFSLINAYLASQLAVDNEVLYGILPGKNTSHLRVFYLSTDDNVFVPIHEAPAFKREFTKVQTRMEAPIAEHSHNNIEKSDDLSASMQVFEIRLVTGGLAVNGHTLYVEYERRLFRWHPGDSEWTDTGLIDTGEPPQDEPDRGLKLAVSGETVYVGKRDGKLFQSLDAGNSWKDVTSNLPLHFECFKELVFVGSTVYVATDTGVLVSQTGEHWSVLTDGTGRPPVIDRLAGDSTSVYGAGDAGLYRLDDRGKWKQVLPSVPGKVNSLVVSNHTLYIATDHDGLFHISLEEKGLKANF